MGLHIDDLFKKMLHGDRVAIGQAITLIESDLDHHRSDSVRLLELCESQDANIRNSLRLTISGAPGVGKSTLIEALGNKAISEGHKVGVITIDPTSNISHGSILGDKARMHQLSLSPSAFVRSSPAGSILGGIGRRSRELMTLLSAIGYDLIFLETVGVGQSEHIAWQLTDGFVLVIQPGAGDELQGIKRGITELADIVVVNKTDGALESSAKTTLSHYKTALHYMAHLRADWEPRVVSSSAVKENGIDNLWEILRLYKVSQFNNPSMEQDRIRQNAFWIQWSLAQTAQQLLMNHPSVNQKLAQGLQNIEAVHNSVFRTEYDIEIMMKQITTSADVSHIKN